MNRLIAIFVVAALFANDTTDAADEVDYLSEVKPLLKARCYACHGSLKQEAGLRLDTGHLLRKGSENGAIVNFAAVAKSELLLRVSSDDDQHRMPPIGMPLSAEQIGLLTKWIAGQAKSPANEKAESDPREHWAFKRPVQSNRPAISNTNWPRNEIDYFLHAEYDKHGIKPVGDATRAQLIRRVYLDLTGLQPTPEELEEFLSDATDSRYRSIVDRLLASAQYGERWARHWMDVWRYSDWYGRRQVNDVRNSAPQIWRWRDWIVDSLNTDKSYARMIQEMLAADEIAPEDDSTWPATGYLIRNYYSLNPNEWMRFNVEYTGKAFLGLTFNCAHCHDHKYDPIAHDDYFRMRAFFEPIGIRQDRVSGGPEPPLFAKYNYGGSRIAVKVGMVRIFDDAPEAPTWFYTDGDERNKDKDRGSIPPGVPAFLEAAWSEIKPVDLPLSGWYPGSRPNIQQTILANQEAQIAKAKAAYAAQKDVTVDTSTADVEVSLAKKKFDAEIQKAKQAGQSGALSGKQSLYIDAASGRRIVQNTLPGLKTVPEGMTIEFQLRILKDDHVNFQLAKDTVEGLTALYIGFVKGKISSYKPGGFSPLALGEYPVAASTANDLPNAFDVLLVLHPSKDIVNVTITQRGAKKALVANKAIALNGWNPTKNKHQPFTLDCRPGSQALFDNFRITAGDQTFEWDFEAPKFSDGHDIDGIDGWLIHSQSVAPATSVVSMIAGSNSVRKSYDRLKQAQATRKSLTHSKTVAALGVEAAKLKYESIQATIAADNARRSEPDSEQAKTLALAAYAKQLAANEADSQWRTQDAELRLIKAQALPDSDKSKKSQIAAINKDLAAARKFVANSNRERATKPTSTDYKLLSPTTAKQSTGRRRALALWITDDRNPLTPRVAINHIWMRHFHEPLVESVSDFGRNGKLPSNPKVLDWLAVELQKNNWSMKHIHRLIVTSRAYQMSSSSVGQTTNNKQDQDNRLLWRMNKGRMEAELVRDSIKSIAGTLDATIGGQVLVNTLATTTNRRSLYYEVYPENGGSIELATVFDAPDPGECFRRTRTIVPQQALALSNSKLIHDSSVLVTKRIVEMPPVKFDDAEFIKRAFRTVLARDPIDQEVNVALKFLSKQRAALKDETKVKAGLVRVLFNHNDFVTIR
jgi:hypothetical protein